MPKARLVGAVVLQLKNASFTNGQAAREEVAAVHPTRRFMVALKARS
jgi:hypothetical protein